MTGEFGIAIHALIYLRHAYPRSVSSVELAENICTNPVRVRKIMSYLSQAKLIEVKKGVKGGYTVPSPTAIVTLADVFKVLQEDFVSTNWQSGAIDLNCYIASGMALVMGGVYAQMNELCLAHSKTITIHDLEIILEERKRNKEQQNEKI